MGINYTNITYNTSYPTPPAIQINNYDGDQTVDGLDVDLSLIGPSGWTPTDYKLWNINGVTTSGEASWVAFSPTAVGELIEQSGEQHVYGEFKDATHMSGIVTSSGVTWSWSDPIIHSSVGWTTAWSSLNYGSASSATLRNSTYNIDIVLNKTGIPRLRWGGKNFSDIRITGNTIQGSSSSYLGGLLNASPSNYVTITKTFETDDTPLVKVDTGSGYMTITKHSGEEKTGLGTGYTDRISNYDWDSETKTLTFRLHKFSTYGFCTVDKVEFTGDSTTAGYNGTSISLKVYVQDSAGEPVENAPVTLSGIAGSSIGNFSANPVYTGADGIATATLNLTALGAQTFDAYVDSVHTDPDQVTRCMEYPANIGRSLLRQYEQIRRTGVYDDAIANVNDSAIAEPTVVTGTESRLEHDMNVFRTIMNQLKGGTNWYDDPGMMFDPTATNSGGADLVTYNAENVRGHFLRNKTVLIAVEDDNSGAGFTVTSGNAGFLNTNITTSYASWSNRTGVPIFSSATGDYPDEGASDNVCVIDLIDTSTGAEFTDSSGDIIYGKFHDGADYGGTGNGTDIYIKFYSDGNPYTLVAGDPTNISMIYPLRKRMSDMNEWEWTRTDFVSSFEGDDELIEDIENLWSYTGAINNDTSPTFTNTGGNYSIGAGTTDLEGAINDLNNSIDTMDFTEDNYISDGDTVADALDKLDQAVKDNADNIISFAAIVYIEALAGDIPAGTLHALTFNYTPESTSGREGDNMDVFVDGQLMSASTGLNGAAADRDYAETTTSGITFHMDLHQDSNITYRVRM